MARTRLHLFFSAILLSGLLLLGGKLLQYFGSPQETKSTTPFTSISSTPPDSSIKKNEPDPKPRDGKTTKSASGKAFGPLKKLPLSTSEPKGLSSEKSFAIKPRRYLLEGVTLKESEYLGIPPNPFIQKLEEYLKKEPVLW